MIETKSRSQLILQEENKNLNEQLKIIKTNLQISKLELIESRENQLHLKHLNTILVNNIQSNIQPQQSLKDIKLILDGDFGHQKIIELEKQLEQYRNGVNSSVERRVKNIVQAYAQGDKVRNDKNEIINQHNECTHHHQHQNNHYNINYTDKQSCKSQYTDFSKKRYLCQNCQKLEKELSDLKQQLQQEKQQFIIINSKNEHYKKKYNNLQKEIKEIQTKNIKLQNLQQKIQLIHEEQLEQLNVNWENQFKNRQREYQGIIKQLEEKIYLNQNYISHQSEFKMNIDRNNRFNEPDTPINQLKLSAKRSNKKAMLKQIQNIMTDLDYRKNNSNKANYQQTNSLYSSKLSQPSLSLFSIKDGINRPNSKGINFD